MKKKIIIAIVAVVVVAAIGVGAYFLIGGAGAPKMEFADTPDVLNKVISTYAEDKTFFAMGGDGSTEVEEGKAGLVNLADKENANFVLHTTDAILANVADAASYKHAMNENIFASAALKLNDAKAAETLIADLKTEITETRWMCGAPEKFVVFSVNGGEYVVYSFGSADNVDYFKAQLTTTLGESAALVVEESLVQ